MSFIFEKATYLTQCKCSGNLTSDPQQCNIKTQGNKLKNA